ncbi:MAG TPA: STAS domain-containing protein [Solirubrobacterales bacterium]|nr:STAS domain-containing protein [Solirubrobacterales bacterium]
MQTFKLVELDHRAGCREIRVEGELDLAVADRLQEAIDRAGEGYSHVLIGLENCDFIDSTGIAIIVGAHNQLAEEGRRVSVYGPSSQVLRVLSVTGLSANGLVFESADEAFSASTEAE